MCRAVLVIIQNNEGCTVHVLQLKNREVTFWKFSDFDNNYWKSSTCYLCSTESLHKNYWKSSTCYLCSTESLLKNYWKSSTCYLCSTEYLHKNYWKSSTCYLCSTESLHNLISLKIYNADIFDTSHPRRDESLSTHLLKAQILPYTCYCYKD